jgi:phospholipid/cholesterol/gamma-HCH transport system ATP-binding protein
MDAAANLRFPLREVLGLSRKESEEKIRVALDDVGLSGQGGLEVRELSGGMQKRLGIARTLVLSPEVALYDDPSAGLDPITSRQILTLIRRMKEKYAMTVVIVTSEPALTYDFTDRIGFLYNGDFLQTGTVDEIRGSRQPVVRQFMEGSLEGPLTAKAEAEAYIDPEGEADT